MGSPPYPPAHHGSRHPSLGSLTTRPVTPLSTDQRTAFEEAVASSSLASTSSGLQALLRDHPELVSSELAKAAGEEWSQLNESARGSRPGTDPPTPGEISDAGSLFSEEAPELGEGGPSLAPDKTATNLGSAGECNGFCFRRVARIGAKRPVRSAGERAHTFWKRGTPHSQRSPGQKPNFVFRSPFGLLPAF